MITSLHVLRMRLLAALVLGAVAVMAAPASAHPEDEPGPSNYRSSVTRLDLVTDAIEVSIGGGDAFLELIAQPGRTVIVHGYGEGGTDPEPYLRINPDGSVDVNGRSPATYLNEDRYAESPVPTEARPDAEPHWVLRAPEGTHMVDWHDHRIHWMAGVMTSSSSSDCAAHVTSPAVIGPRRVRRRSCWYSGAQASPAP